MKILKQGIYLIIFCLPLYLVRFEIFKIPTTVLELLIYALFVLWIIKGGYRSLWAVLKHERLLVWGILLLLLGVSIATIFSWDIRISAGIWKAWFIDALLFLFVFVTVIKKEDVKKVFNSLIFSGLVVAIISLVYLICGNLNYQGRLQGIFNSPNYLAMYLAVPFILCLARIICTSTRVDAPARRHALSRIGFGPCNQSCETVSLTNNPRHNLCLMPCILYLVMCVLFLVVLFFTKSFGVLLGTISAIGLSAIIYFYQKNKKILAMGLIIIGFAIILVFGLIKIQSIEGLKSFDARFAIWDKAIDAFLENPFTGIGPGTFELYFPPFPKWGVPQPHNIFLAFLIQTGLVGFVGFVLILIWFYKNNTKNLVLLCLMTYLLAHGLVDTTYWKNDLSLMFWIVIGTALILQFYRVKSAIGFVDKE